MRPEVRLFLAKSVELTGLVVVGIALLVGVQDNDMDRELSTLGLGAVVFVAGWLLERGGGSK